MENVRQIISNVNKAIFQCYYNATCFHVNTKLQKRNETMGKFGEIENTIKEKYNYWVQKHIQTFAAIFTLSFYIDSA